MSGITASVVLYRTPAAQVLRLHDCLSRSSLRPDLYIIDNSPEPTTLPFEKVPWITYIHTEANLGYGAGHNIALSAGQKCHLTHSSTAT